MFVFQVRQHVVPLIMPQKSTKVLREQLTRVRCSKHFLCKSMLPIILKTTSLILMRFSVIDEDFNWKMTEFKESHTKTGYHVVAWNCGCHWLFFVSWLSRTAISSGESHTKTGYHVVAWNCGCHWLFFVSWLSRTAISSGESHTKTGYHVVAWNSGCHWLFFVSWLSRTAISSGAFDIPSIRERIAVFREIYIPGVTERLGLPLRTLPEVLARPPQRCPSDTPKLSHRVPRHDHHNIIAKITLTIDHKVSLYTVRRHLHAAGIHNYKPAMKPAKKIPLTEEHCQARIRFATGLRSILKPPTQLSYMTRSSSLWRAFRIKAPSKSNTGGKRYSTKTIEPRVRYNYSSASSRCTLDTHNFAVAQMVEASPVLMAKVAGVKKSTANILMDESAHETEQLSQRNIGRNMKKKEKKDLAYNMTRSAGTFCMQPTSASCNSQTPFYVGSNDESVSPIAVRGGLLRRLPSNSVAFYSFGYSEIFQHTLKLHNNGTYSSLTSVPNLHPCPTPASWNSQTPFYVDKRLFSSELLLLLETFSVGPFLRGGSKFVDATSRRAKDWVLGPLNIGNISLSGSLAECMEHAAPERRVLKFGTLNL
ncbi:transposase domain-containing protein [Phthorimaea operculella]|nr:transposase domain-containing protein [Phthorimaea operculella]